MCEKAIWLDIALLCCIFTRLRLVKIRPHTSTIQHTSRAKIVIYMYKVTVELELS